MGILSAHSIIKPRLQVISPRYNETGEAIYPEGEEPPSTLPLDRRYHLNIDGPLLLFKGHTSVNLNSEVPEEKLVESVIQTIGNIVAELRDVYGLYFERVRIYFDGERPALKEQTSAARGTPWIDRSFATKLLIKQIRQLNPMIEIVELKHGEAENEFFHDRDKDADNVFVTSDSDLYHIVYNSYDPKSDAKLIFYNTQDRTVYDLKFSFKYLSRNAFKLLLFMLGSDFTAPVLTQSMVQRLIELLPLDTGDGDGDGDGDALDGDTQPVDRRVEAVHREVQEISDVLGDADEVCVSDVQEAVFRVLVVFALMREAGVKFSTPQRKTKKLSTLVVDDQYDLYTSNLAWCINYSNVGARIRDYNSTNAPSIKPNVIAISYFEHILRERFEYPRPISGFANLLELARAQSMM